MRDFFDLTENHEVQIPMYGFTHMITVIVMLLLLIIILWQRNRIKRLVSNKLFLKRFLLVYLILEAFYWALIWGYRIEPLYERFPLHLCGSLSILMAMLILLQKHNPLEVPFLPASFTVWPWSYPSFVAVGIVLFHLAYLSFKSLKPSSVRT